MAGRIVLAPAGHERSQVSIVGQGPGSQPEGSHQDIGYGWKVNRDRGQREADADALAADDRGDHGRPD